MSTQQKRQYVSKTRSQAADATKARVLRAARALFVRHGIDRTTVARVAARARVSVPTVYALYKSKEGILRELMSAALFGQGFQAAHAKLKGISDPIKLIALTAHVARAIYNAESSELGLMRGASAFSLLFGSWNGNSRRFVSICRRSASGSSSPNPGRRRASDLMRHGGSSGCIRARDVYRMLVHESGWTPDQYQSWLSETLVSSLVGS